MSTPVPTPQQLRWQEWGLGIFFHVGVNTFADAEWSDGTLSPDLFDPTDLDVDSWVAHAARWGARYAVLTAKHHDGFCLWPTAVTDYSVASSPWQGGAGDVVREFAEACARHDIAMGLYLSPWDRHAPEYADPDAYRDYYLAQLTELCTGYGPICEMWFDGAGSEGYTYDWPAIMRVVRTHQPEALVFNMGDPDIRWVGNEDGLAPDTVSYVTRSTDFSQYTDVTSELDKAVYLPPECDVSIRPGWFWHEHEEPKSVEHLVAIHERSIGRGANLLLNIPPAPSGRLDARDIERMDEFIAALAVEAEADTVNRVWLHEDLSDGQQIGSFTIESNCRPIASGTSVGSQRLCWVEEVPADSIRVRVDRGSLCEVRTERSPRPGPASLPEQRASRDRPESTGHP